jgi:predicted RNA-binding protein with PIN domain
MGIHIVIDGYNLIRQSRQFSDIDRQDLQSGRDALVDALVAYKKVKPYAITVVFDGTAAYTGMPRRDVQKGIKVCYSAPGETADAVIKKMVVHEKEKILVVTSDADIVRYAETMGSVAISSSEFEDRLMMAQYMDLKGIDDFEEEKPWSVTTKKKGPSRRLPKRQRKMKKKLSKL